jgi:flagellar protein FliS
MYAAKLEQYQSVNLEAQVMEADGHRLVQMLFDGAIERISAARAALEAGNLARKGELVSKAIIILGGLRETLDFKAGGELAENLDGLYAYMQRKLLEAHAKNQPQGFAEVIDLLCPLAEAWRSIPQSVRQTFRQEAA